MLDTAKTRWHPIAASYDLPFRHVFHAQLLGREFAVWRADDGYVNIWENRCLHRGVRLSIGINDGRELKCQYHGWRYSNRTAGCTYIPAHPADAPARTITNRTFAGVERYGLVWSAEEPHGRVPDVAGLREGEQLALRGIPLNAPADAVVSALTGYRFQPNGRLQGNTANVSLEGSDTFSVALRAYEEGAETLVVFFVQPVDSSRSVIRGVLDAGPQGAERLAILRHHNERLSKLREIAEREAQAAPQPAPLEPVIERVSPELAEMPEMTAHGRKATIRVTVARKWLAADGIAAFELRPVQGLLPTFQPGAHIDVHMPNGLVRQYSITNGPGESDSYVIGVKLERDSMGGSLCMHETVREGDLLAISEPRNNFPLRRDAVRTIFVAGGIGVTPLLAMAQALKNQNLDYEFHYFAQNQEQLAFPEKTAVLGEALKPHLGFLPETTAAKLKEILSGYRPDMHVYLCGPGPMLEAARRIAADLGWPETAVHFEYFKNTNTIDDSSSFEVALARSCVTLQVTAGKTILETMREAGIDMPSSCEQGACGTCLATVIEGEPDHQDVYLNDAERKSGTKIMTCVSRARSARLVLDL
ncbi:Rieske 2Fe-2S domain-containing protein [Sinorhizobium medicae]|uniref:Rieske 2Fe-2S domain-containing protein n=1 Tax=Sinorhizobium medicae TaxID=110321 RepID=UPI0003FB1535|nr:Rieske 2Fe-2S domain-containing protein [Sinorhizobium medicae]MDX0468614.1 Rieske 2Fe-2S domain-containing protein [Sinorhizobium medicae]MDX0548793.1 Rieske 2Fe-2S domain-containing protein [Sinorhizobium medicae]MDX0641512.1 Rieske 2Fe-2S domain-containing protein [Sinorhizobium medicae]MDX0660000.1 Rieske 2Fe-2S domain-containing protein [Sinorhizobium medicae]MDX0679206.1 Rieske 2Fe-2S domain-containing protein [Sinorhizobium medicae]